MLASTAFFGSLRALTSIKDTIIEIDSQLISLKKVMDADTNFESMLRSATESAKEFGRTIDGALQSYERYAKMGFNQFQVESLARNAMLLSTVGDIDDAKSAEYLTAALLQFNMALEDGLKVVDSWNHVSNQFPVTVEDLALGFTRAASAANVANVTFDELSGMITSIQASTRRGGQQIGNSLRTIFTNLNSSKAQKALEELDIQVKNTDGSLRSATEVFGELSQKWDTLTNAEQSYTAESIANKFHINNFMAMMTNWQMVIDSTTQSVNSHGSATKELSTFQEGLAFKINNLKASWQELSLVMGTEGGFKTVIEGIISSLTFMAEGFTNLTESTNGWNVKLPVIIALGYGAVKMFNALKLAATGAKLSLGWIGVGLIAVELLASVFMGSAKATDINTEALMKNAEQHKENSDKIKDLISQHDKLKQEVEDGAEKQEELKNVLEQIRKISPQLIEVTGEYGDTLTLNKEKADLYIKSLEKLTEEQLNHAKTLENIELARATADMDNIQKELDKIENSVKDSFAKIEEFQLEFDVSGIIDAEEEISKRLESLKDKWNSTTDQIEIDKITEEMLILRARLKEYVKLMNSDDLGEYTNKHKALIEVEGNVEGIEKRIETIEKMIDGTYDSTEALDKLKYSFEDTEDAIDDHANALDSNTDSLWNNISATEVLFGKTSQHIQQIRNAIEVYTLLTQAENLNAQQSEQLVKAKEFLASMFPHLVKGTELNINAMIKEADIIEGMGKLSADYANGRLSTEDAMTFATVSGVNQRIQAYEKELHALNEAKKSAVSMLKEIGKVAEATGYYDYDAEHGALVQWQNASAQIPKLERAIYESSAKMRNAWESSSLPVLSGMSPKSSGSSNSSSKSGGSSTKDEPNQKDKLDAYIREINLQNQLIALDNEKLKLQVDQAKSQEDYNKQIEITNKLIEGQQSQVSALQKANQQIHQKANAIREESRFDTSNWFDNNNQETQEFIDLYNSLSKTEQEIAQNTFNRLQKLKSAYGENVEEIKKLREENNKLTESLVDVSEKIKGLITNEITNQQTQHLDHLREKFEQLNNTLSNLIKPDEIFNTSEFQHSIAEIIAELDKLDGVFMSNPLFRESTSSVRSSVSTTSKEILNMANSIKQMTSITSENQYELEQMIRSQSQYANQLKDQINLIDQQIRQRQLEHKRTEDALSEQIRLRQEQIKQLDEQYDKEDRLRRLQDINDEIDKVKADRRFEYIDKDGNVVLTYNKARVNELQIQRDDMLKQFQRDDIKKAMNDEVARLQDRLQKTRDINQAEIQQLQLHRNALNTLYSGLVSNTNSKMNDLKQLQDKHLKETEKNWNDIIEAVKNGTMSHEALMNGWYGQSISGLDGFIINLSSRIAEVRALFSSLNNLSMSNPSIPSAGFASGGGSGSGGLSTKSSSNSSNTSNIQTQGHDYKVDANGNVWKNGNYVPAENFKWIPDEVLDVAREVKANKFHDGGIVGGKTGKIGEILNKLFNTNANETVITSLLGELQVPPQNFTKFAIPNIQKMFNMISPQSSMQPVITEEHYHFNNMTIKTDNAETFLDGIRFKARSHKR